MKTNTEFLESIRTDEMIEKAAREYQDRMLINYPSIPTAAFSFQTGANFMKPEIERLEKEIDKLKKANEVAMLAIKNYALCDDVGVLARHAQKEVDKIIEGK